MPVPQQQVDVEKELQRLNKQLDQVSGLLESTEKQITPQFLERANPTARAKIMQKRYDLRQQKVAIEAQLQDLKGSVSEPTSRRETVMAAIFGLGLISRPQKSEAAVGEGDVLPEGARQEDRIRKGLEAWKKLPEKLVSPEDPAKEWENAQGFLRRLYGLKDDMSYLTRGLRGDKRKESETLIATFQKRVKLADKPAKAKDYAAFMEFHKEIVGYLEEFQSYLVDATEELTMEPEDIS